MADLSEIQSSQSVKIAGAGPSTGIETNWMSVDSNGNANVIATSAGSVTPGTVATNSELVGGQYNTSLPTLTNTQQSAIQLDSSGRILIGVLPTGSNTIGAVTQASGPWTQNITQFGSSNVVTGTGASGAGIPRVTVSNDSNILATQSGTWNIGTLTSITNPVAVTQSGTWTVQPGNTANTTPWLVTDSSDGPVTAGTAATKSNLIGGQYNSSLPTLTTGQQAAIQLDVNGRLVTRLLTLSDLITANLAGYSYSSYSPDPSSYPTSNQTTLNIDAVGRLETHSTVTTDEGSFRSDFSGSTLTNAITGTLTFTNGSTVITGSGTSFTTQISNGQWVKKSTDSETLYVQVSAVGNDTTLYLNTAYSGTTASVAGVISDWQTFTGGSIAVASSICTLNSGTGNGLITRIVRTGDYLPYTLNLYAAITQRIANQVAIVGFADTWPTPNQQATIQFSGTDNTKVTFVTSSSSAAADTQSTIVTLPAAGTTNTYHTYTIDLTASQATLSIDNIVMVTQAIHLPMPYANLQIGAQIQNSAVVTTTGFQVDYLYFANWDRVQIADDFAADPMPVNINNFPASQAVSLATLPSLVAGAAAIGTVGVTSLPSIPTGANVIGAVTQSGGPWSIAGNVADGTADSGNTVKVGGVYYSALPSYTSGQRGHLELDVNGRLIVNLGTALPTGANAIGSITNTSFIATQATAANLNATVTQQTITKGTQGSTGVTIQALKDAGRNTTNYFMASQVLTTNTDTLQSLTGYTSGAAVGATTTPAVVPAGKIYRINRITITYIAVTTAGTAQINLRANTGGTVVIGSPLVESWSIGAGSITAGTTQTIVIDIPDGLEFAAGTGIGVSIQGIGATGTAAAAGYAKVSIAGYQY